MNAKTSFLISILAIATGCQRMVESGSSEALQKSASCSSVAASDSSTLAIVGSDAAHPGDVLNYQLSNDVGCGGGASVSWKMLNAAGEGGRFALQIKKAGAYVVTAEVQGRAQTSPTIISKQTTVSQELVVNGPQIGMAYVENTFALVVPPEVPVRSVTWDLGDGTTSNVIGSVTHAFTEVGAFTITVTVTLGSGAVQTLTRSIQILPTREGFECVNQLAISGATTVGVNVPASLALFVPTCLTAQVKSLAWSFGDGGPLATAQAVTHAYANVGSYPVTVSIFTSSSTVPFATLTTTMTVTATDSGTDPSTPDLNQCDSIGLARTVTGDLYTEDVKCGVDGHKTNSYRDDIAQSCQKPGDVRQWIETGRTKRLINEGVCQGQSCEIAVQSAAEALAHGLVALGGKFYLRDGAGTTFFTSGLPAGACSDVAQVRACANGELGGSTAATLLTCASGCAGLGPSGTILSNQVTGQESVPKTCAFGETGVFDLFTQVSDRVCTDGVVSIANTSRGSLTLAGNCPVYTLAPTNDFTACSADCGGTQAQIFACVDAANNAVPAERCAPQTAPVVTRACDGNPDAVKRVEVVTTSEEGGQSKTCPKNEIGVVVQSRDKITTNTYACVNHAAAISDTTVTYGDWTSQAYCRDYVAYRCSQDSLSNDASSQRLQWMLKCQDQVPQIKEFLNEFASYESGTDQKPFLLYNHRMVYATFMDRATTPEKVWKAPVKATASCDVPATAYIAAVCTASCATPEQQILAEAADTRKLAYGPIGTAWAAQLKAVATLAKGASLDAKRVSKTPVDQWVTEMMDGEHDILDFHFRSGGVLRLTPNHPVVTDVGTIKLASDFKVGENFVKLGGAKDEIVDIVPTKHFGKVFNLFVKTNDPKANLVVTNGYLNGTAYFQNDGATWVNRQILRHDLTRGAW